MLPAQGLYNDTRVMDRASIEQMFTPTKYATCWTSTARWALLVSLALWRQAGQPGIRTFQHSGGGDDFAAQVTVLPTSSWQ